MVPPTRRILPTITYSDPTAGEPPQDVYRLFRGDSSPYTSICTKWRRILSAVVVIWRFVAPLSSSMAYTNAHDPSPPSSSHLIRGSLKTYCCMWRRWLWWVLLPFNCRYIRESGGYICCYCGDETSPCGTGIYFDNLGIMYKGTYDVHYSKHNNNIQLVDWWRKYKYLQFTYNPFTLIICQHIHLKHVSFFEEERVHDMREE